MEIVNHKIKLKEMNNEDIRVWSKNIAKDNVVLLKDQNLSKEDLVRIYDSIGRVCMPVDRKTGKKEFFADDDYPQLMRVTNERKDGETRYSEITLSTAPSKHSSSESEMI